jgi:hypothetical protein
MSTATLNITAPMTIKVRFAPAATFSVRVRTGLSARPTIRARISHISGGHNAMSRAVQNNRRGTSSSPLAPARWARATAPNLPSAVLHKGQPQ